MLIPACKFGHVKICSHNYVATVHNLLTNSNTLAYTQVYMYSHTESSIYTFTRTQICSGGGPIEMKNGCVQLYIHIKTKSAWLRSVYLATQFSVHLSISSNVHIQAHTGMETHTVSQQTTMSHLACKNTFPHAH